MKHIILLLLIAGIVSGQENYRWDIVMEIDQSKESLFLNSKEFASRIYKGGSKAIKFEDAESGKLILPGSYTHELTAWMSDFNYKYDFDFIIMVKEGKVRAMIQNVHCDRLLVKGVTNPACECIQPFTGDNYVKGSGSCGVPSKKKQAEMMESLRSWIVFILDEYFAYIKEVDDDW
jgi:hypothetical protein